MGCRRLYALVKGLPPDAALWREMAPEQTNGDRPESDGTRIATNDPNEIAAFFNKYVS